MIDPIVHHPFMYHLGPLPLSGFGLAVMGGFVIGGIVAARELARRGYDSAAVEPIVGASIVGFLIGAKLYYAALVRDASVLLSPMGYVFWGGLAGGVAGGMLMARWKGMPIMRISDVAGPGIAAGYAVGRTGCWAVGDDYGRPWDSPLAVAFPEGIPPSTVANLQAFGIKTPAGASPDTVLAVHPTQLYETALGFVMFLILWRLRGHRHAEGWLFGVYLVLAGVERFLIEFLRAKDDRFFGGLTLAQVIALAMVTIGVVWAGARWRPAGSSESLAHGAGDSR
jgi:phosphatidylglycerol:prolipoprotein diacylglycerol transferase